CSTGGYGNYVDAMDYW
nr:immunoglobulin heavy chain junction region [Mus musculus]NSM04224.1 immunoglobulin heavy chain junction region [Mus musculus]NSM04706.1 immunoglobulin heavy chain junction region [Mus musculus]NSM05098.1 immunoglobulin heavy chain junction region [Mus musculus]NSM05508.1 immunoglobulin heavy chain junction region [Mus musculus]